ncbi:MAG: HNH endonuclease [Paludibacteraceae bacterium]|nr:HNH endonuclease [Paludibacteraceae bacterium]
MKFYKIIINPKYEYFDKNDYDIYKSIHSIVRVFKIEVANSFLLSLLREYTSKEISQKMLVFALNNIEHLHFINNAICSGRSSGYDNLYSKYAQKLYRSKNREEKHQIIKDLVKDLQQRIPDYEDYQVNFNKKVYFTSTETKQKALVQYILTKLESKENKNAILINTSLEHIYPEKPNGNWEQLNNSDNIKYIGNLVLLDSNLNSSIGNNIFLKKKNIVQKKSKIITTKKVFDAVSWTEENIEKRTQDVIEIMYSEIWNKD